MDRVDGFNFLDIDDTVYGENVTTESLYSIEEARVIGCAMIDEKGKVTNDISSPNNQDPWFLIKVKIRGKRRIFALVNEEKYILARGDKHLKIDNEWAAGYQPFSTVDKMVLHRAIKIYTNLFD